VTHAAVKPTRHSLRCPKCPQSHQPVPLSNRFESHGQPSWRSLHHPAATPTPVPNCTLIESSGQPSCRSLHYPTASPTSTPFQPIRVERPAQLPLVAPPHSVTNQHPFPADSSRAASPAGARCTTPQRHQPVSPCLLHGSCASHAARSSYEGAARAIGGRRPLYSYLACVAAQNSCTCAGVSA